MKKLVLALLVLACPTQATEALNIKESTKMVQCAIAFQTLGNIEARDSHMGAVVDAIAIELEGKHLETYERKAYYSLGYAEGKMRAIAIYKEQSLETVAAHIITEFNCQNKDYG
ncbi:hypothetical protein [Vibrio fortis]|uniref:hypothetical protein n=1 Tax=Vibrio fortis TaxID=212667 RepID=UPI003EBA1A39